MIELRRLPTHAEVSVTRSELADLIIDGMDTKTLMCYAHEQLMTYFDDMTDEEFQEEVERHA